MKTKTKFTNDANLGILIQRKDINGGKPTPLAKCHTGILSSVVGCLNRYYDKDVDETAEILKKMTKDFEKNHKLWWDGEHLCKKDKLGRKRRIMEV